MFPFFLTHIRTLVAEREDGTSLYSSQYHFHSTKERVINFQEIQTIEELRVGIYGQFP